MVSLQSCYPGSQQLGFTSLPVTSSGGRKLAFWRVAPVPPILRVVLAYLQPYQSNAAVWFL